jgi:divalent metal cation (Fe/Co/Zn/Cd) transporter
MAWFGKPSAQDDARAEAYRLWLSRQHSLSIISAVLGTVSLLDFGVVVVFQIAGLIVGILALQKLDHIAKENIPAPRPRGRRLAWIGIGLSSISLLIAFILYFWHPTRLHGN